MTVQELMEVLRNMDPNKVVHVWNAEWDSADPLNEVEVKEDGELVLYY